MADRAMPTDTAQKHLEQIRESFAPCQKRLGMVSLLVMGAFGRGEGSVISRGGKLLPLNDYDLCLVTKRNLLVARYFAERIVKELKKSLPVYSIDVFVLKECELASLPPLIINYEIKYGSALLWGRDVISEIPDYKASDIPLEDGAKLLFNRCISLLLGFPDRANDEFSLYQSAKALCAIAESMLLLCGKYHFTYRQRRDNFSKAFPAEFPGLKIDYPALSAMVDKAMEFKLHPDYGLFPNPQELWLKTRDFYLDIFHYYLNRLYKTDFEDLGKLIEFFFSRQKQSFSEIFVPWLIYNLRHKNLLPGFNIRFHPHIFVNAASPFVLRGLHSNNQEDIA
ncbi:MAG: hypothetical protein ACOY3D_06020, partial [Candidatus Omnitrophota bacterium]